MTTTLGKVEWYEVDRETGEADIQSGLLAALEEVAGSSHGPRCAGFEARKLRFSCSCHVSIAKASGIRRDI